MRIVIISIAILLLLTINCFAVQKVYYDPTTGKQIVDLSGKKPIEKIKQEFGDKDYQVIEIDEVTETYQIENGTLKKYNHKERDEQNKQEREKQVKIKENEIKQKLGLSDKELESLKDILR